MLHYFSKYSYSYLIPNSILKLCTKIRFEKYRIHFHAHIVSRKKAKLIMVKNVMKNLHVIRQQKHFKSLFFNS